MKTIEMKSVTEQLEPKITSAMEKKYFDKFTKQSGYRGNGVYSVSGTNLFSTDTRELFLMFIAAQENIKYKKV